jgi:integrase
VADGRGLALEVRPSGQKYWRYRYRIDGAANMFTMGEYPSVTLSAARDALKDARELVKAGVHPRDQKRLETRKRAAAKKNTFKAVADERVDSNRTRWSGYYLNQVERAMREDAFPAFGDSPIKDVHAADLLNLIKSIEARGAPTVAILVRQWCSAIFRYGIATLRCEGDPAASLKGAVARPKVQHHKPLGRNEIGGFLNALNDFGGYETTRIALHLLLRLFVRPGELRQAKWPEFDLKEALWRIPKERMKMREEHLVPLPTQAVTLLEQLRGLTGNREFAFPNYRRPNACMTNTTLNRALERMGYGGRFSSHGFRATASTILNEMGYRTDVIERQLAHKERTASRAAYNRALYVHERRGMMQDWADYLDGLRGDELT